MAGATAQGATFSFTASGSVLNGKLLGVSVEMPTAEVTNMTAAGDSLGYTFMVPTGEQSGGTIMVEFLTWDTDLWTFVKRVGDLKFVSVGYSISRRVICESASVSAQTGELVRASVRFLITDYLGT